MSDEALNYSYSSANPDRLKTLDKATPGPWTVAGLKVFQGSGHGAKALLRLADGNTNPADLVFAACARQDIDWLRGAVSQYHRERDEAREALSLATATLEHTQQTMCEAAARASELRRERDALLLQLYEYEQVWWRRAWRWVRGAK